MNPTAKNRNAALDLIRCTAALCLVSLHFFLHSGFYRLPQEGAVVYLLTLLRTGSMICVPLFLLLSGYLLGRKQPDRSYYITLLRTVGIYLLASLTSLLHKVWTQGDAMGPRDYVTQFLNYELSNYGWYIEMYIGLFLLIPFLNILYQGLGSQRLKQRFLLVMLLLSAAHGVLMLREVSLAPDWWSDLYPLTYYFIGCYLHEYPTKRKPVRSFLLFLAVCTVFGSYCFLRSDGQRFLWGTWQNWGSGFLVLQSVLIFQALSALDLSRVPKPVTNALAYISDRSLGLYLLSSIFDNAFYPILLEKVPDTIQRFRWYPVMVGAVFLCALALSALVYRIYGWTFGRLLNKLKQSA